jgi:hypothetical protein
MAQIIYQFVPLLMIAFPILEPLLSRYISASMRKRLKSMKQRGTILDYKTKTRRLGKMHYKIAVDVDLTREHMVLILTAG